MQLNSRQGVALATFLFAYYAYIGVFTPFASLYFAAHGMAAAQIGVLMSLIQVMRIFGPNIWGWVADHLQRRVAVLRLTAWATFLTFGALLFDHGFAYFFVVMVVINLFSSAQVPLSEALLITALRGDLSNYGRLRLWGSIGFIVAVTTAGQVFDWFGVDAVPWAALVTLALVGLASQRIKEMPELPHGEPHAPPPSVRALLMRRDVQAFFVSTFLMLAAHSAIYSFYSLYLEQIGYSKTVIGMMWSLGVLAEIAFFYFQAPLFRYFGVRSMMLASLLLAVVRFAMIGTGAGSLLVLLAAQLLHGATFGIHNSASVATLQRWFAGPLQARGQALFASLSYGLGGTLGSLAMSVVWDGIGASAVFLLASGLALGGLLAAWLSYRWQDAYVAR